MANNSVLSEKLDTADYEQVLAQLEPTDLQALCERRFHRGHFCPRCDSKRVHGHGSYRGRKRFLCVKCGRTFNELTLSPMHGTRYPEKWKAYVCCLFWGLSLRRTARLLEISLPTAFAWRHKLLTAIRKGGAALLLDGILELDEIYVLESQKGNRNLQRPPRKRGTGQSMSRWLARPNRACVLAVRDRRDGTFSDVISMGQPTVFQLEQALSGIRVQATALCRDNRQAYWSFSIRHHLPRYLFHHPRQRRGLYHVGGVDRFLIDFENWMSRFNGVATRYLPNYVKWFTEHEAALQWRAGPEGVAQVWLNRSYDTPVRTTYHCPMIT